MLLRQRRNVRSQVPQIGSVRGAVVDCVIEIPRLRGLVFRARLTTQRHT
jgi:hypothetical protein